MWIIKEFKDSSNDHYFKFQLWTACCKEVITVRFDGPNNFYWLERLEKTSLTLTHDINMAIKEWRARGNKEL